MRHPTRWELWVLEPGLDAPVASQIGWYRFSSLVALSSQAFHPTSPQKHGTMKATPKPGGRNKAFPFHGSRMDQQGASRFSHRAGEESKLAVVKAEQDICQCSKHMTGSQNPPIAGKKQKARQGWLIGLYSLSINCCRTCRVEPKVWGILREASWNNRLSNGRSAACSSSVKTSLQEYQFHIYIHCGGLRWRYVCWLLDLKPHLIMVVTTTHPSEIVVINQLGLSYLGGPK